MLLKPTKHTKTATILRPIKSLNQRGINHSPSMNGTLTSPGTGFWAWQSVDDMLFFVLFIILFAKQPSGSAGDNSCWSRRDITNDSVAASTSRLLLGQHVQGDEQHCKTIYLLPAHYHQRAPLINARFYRGRALHFRHCCRYQGELALSVLLLCTSIIIDPDGNTRLVLYEASWCHAWYMI